MYWAATPPAEVKSPPTTMSPFGITTCARTVPPATPGWTLGLASQVAAHYAAAGCEPKVTTNMKASTPSAR
ncbi:MAG: hypothetical protein ACO3QC_12750 [Phycisphaerales bacterium]